MVPQALIPAAQADATAEHILDRHAGGQGQGPKGHRFDRSIAPDRQPGAALLQPAPDQGQLTASSDRQHGIDG